MDFCFRCGKALPPDSCFCPYCSQSLAFCQPAEAAPQKPGVNGGIKGKSIASIVLGGNGLAGCLVLPFLLIFFLLDTLAFRNLEGANTSLFSFAVIGFDLVFISLTMLGYSIPGKVLAKKALAQAPGYRPALIGNKLSTVCIIISAAALATGISLFLLAALI